MRTRVCSQAASGQRCATKNPPCRPLTLPAFFTSHAAKNSVPSRQSSRISASSSSEPSEDELRKSRKLRSEQRAIGQLSALERSFALGSAVETAVNVDPQSCACYPKVDWSRFNLQLLFVDRYTLRCCLSLVVWIAVRLSHKALTCNFPSVLTLDNQLREEILNSCDPKYREYYEEKVCLLTTFSVYESEGTILEAGGLALLPRQLSWLLQPCIQAVRKVVDVTSPKLGSEEGAQEWQDMGNAQGAQEQQDMVGVLRGTGGVQGVALYTAAKTYAGQCTGGARAARHEDVPRLGGAGGGLTDLMVQ
eukprot:gene22187-29250_t